jgi:beta-lactamase regulating signal transducer with metallopeptidase domain
MTLDASIVTAAASGLLHWIGAALLFGTLLAALTWVILRLIGRRISPAMNAAFWLIVLVKFVLPVGPGWSYSLATTLNGIVHGSQSLLAVPAGLDAPTIAVTRTIVVDGVPADAPTAAPTTLAPRRPAISTILATAYLILVGSIAAIRLTAYIRFLRRARRFAPADASIKTSVAGACRTLGVRRVPDVRLSPDAPAPFVFGLVRPVLVLSPRQLVRPDELEAVILHEVAHLRRGDLIVRAVQWLAGTMLFFWPVVAWVNRRIDLARESACDEWALRHGRLSAGAYARCLLAAMHPLRRGGWAYRPAAMAANLSTVERRIEMILNSSVRTQRLAAGVPVALAALAWAGFVLTGMARAEDPAPQKTEQPPVFVEAESNGDGQVEVKLIQSDAAGPGRAIWAQDGFSPEKLKVRMLRAGIPTEQQLAEFLTAHPTADANGDGKLSQAERSAYFAALAMHDSTATMQQFPKADTNADGQLSADEAAQLVTGGMFMRRIEGPRGADGAKVCQEDVIIARFDRRDGKAAPIEPPGNPEETAAWLLANVNYAPPATEVAQYVEAVESAPFAAILKRHPEADTDGDGKLSAAEREVFFKTDHQRIDAMLLKHFPEADTNGDGVLSRDEIRAIKGRRVVVRKNEASGETQTESGPVQTVENAEQVIIIQSESKDSANE